MVTYPGKLLSCTGRDLAIVTHRNPSKTLVSPKSHLVSSKHDYGQLIAMIVVNSSHGCCRFAYSKGLETPLDNMVKSLSVELFFST